MPMPIASQTQIGCAAVAISAAKRQVSAPKIASVIEMK
jgi:hypothetical protein